MKQWTDKYRPKSLEDLIGNGYSRMTLQKFVARPYSSAWVFHGPTGTGKSTAAECVARALGVDPVRDMIEVRSGELDQETTQWLARQFRFVPMGGPDAWRVIVAEEADTMTSYAERMFLSLIDSDNIPDRTVVIFTTNKPEWFRARPALARRVEFLSFEAPADVSIQDVEVLIRKVWADETGTAADAPTIEEIGDVIDESGQVSFGRVVKGLQRIHRERSEVWTLEPPKVRAPDLLDLCGPFGSRPEPLARVVPAPEPAPVQDIKPTAAATAPDPEPIELDLAANWTPTAVPTRSYRIERIQPDPTPDPYTAAQDWVRSCASRPTVKSVAKRYGIAWATAARYVAEVFGPPPIRTAIYPKSNSRPPGPELQPATPAPRFWATGRGLVLNPGYMPDHQS